MWNKLMGRIADFRRTKRMLGDIQLTFACGLAVLICEETNIPANSHNIDFIGHNIKATATEGPLAAKNEIIDLMEKVVAWRKGEISRDAVVTSVKFKTVAREYNYWVANRPEDFQLNAYTIRH